VSQRDLLIFDLDGTLIDSERDLADSVNAMRAWKGLEALPIEVIASYVGEGAPVLVRRALPDANEEELSDALRYFLDYYREHMLDSTVLYPGVREALDQLHDRGVPMAVLTNKPVRFSLQMLERLGLDLHFFRVYGGNSFTEKKPNPVGIDALVLESRADRARTVMVGDSAVDVRTARNAKVRACGVNWGFQPETFAVARPDWVIDDPAELVNYAACLTRMSTMGEVTIGPS
jgi:phosphoglycolate phosphatase